MTVTDAGPLIALVSVRDAAYSVCRTLLPTLAPPLVTTLPCLTEALYFLGKYGGYPAQESLLLYRKSGLLSVHETTDTELDRAIDLMKIYREQPCDFADASLLAVAESLEVQRIFTLDGHFYAYRLQSGSVLEILPGPLR